ncbi:MAG: hypothetical protein HY735_34455 [Verrucomicrobia bacterium]|nr:hypothetical protein [Verrucomicrobiota bacterium]
MPAIAHLGNHPSHRNLPAHQARQQQVARMLGERLLDEPVSLLMSVKAMLQKS